MYLRQRLPYVGTPVSQALGHSSLTDIAVSQTSQSRRHCSLADIAVSQTSQSRRHRSLSEIAVSQKLQSFRHCDTDVSQAAPARCGAP